VDGDPNIFPLTGTLLTPAPVARDGRAEFREVAVDDEVRLRDGTRLVVRPIRPADADELVALHARLSADTIYRRYFGMRPHLAPTDVERFTNVDGRMRFAFVAVRGGDLVAVARYEGTVGASAELAVVVDDALQHQGIGRLMLGRLVDVAREHGIDRLRADVLVGNRAMLGLLRATGLTQHTERDAGVATVVLDLTALHLRDDRRERARRHIARAGAEAPSAGSGTGGRSGGSNGSPRQG
jgi:GNAT superfamily N-acetyltransferase